jgi:tetratricopeptide (TPR) repeat protein
MSVIPRFLLFLGLAWLTFVLFSEARVVNRQPDVDASKVVLLFGSVVLVGGLTGVLFVLMVMPSIGDAVGNFFFQPNQQATRDPHADAQAALARGDYAEAIEQYRNVLASDPSDTLAYSEIAKISCEHLADPAIAAQTLEQALKQEWSPDDAAFLSNRLADIYWEHQRDARNARMMLLQIIESLPNTRHAANAQHRLSVIDQQIALEG